jgi:hypothetical protein
MTGGTALFDRALYLQRLAKARRAEPDPLSRAVAAELADRLTLINRTFDRALVIAPDARPFAEALQATGKLRDIATRHPPANDDLDLQPHSLDALFDMLDLHAANDVPGRIAQAARALRPDGLYVACLLAGDTLTELRQSWLTAEDELWGGASPRVAPMAGVRELGALLQRAGLALPVADFDSVVVRYADALALMREIAGLGMSNMLAGRTRRPVSRRLLGAALSHYQTCFADRDGRIRATLELAWLTAWAPHESQQKPLKPGSARARLADALKVPEQKLP